MIIEQVDRSSRTALIDGEKFHGDALVLDSSFNPPTMAHKMLILLSLRTQLTRHVSTVVLLLCTRNADKPAPSPTQIQQRLSWMRLLAAELAHETNHHHNSLRWILLQTDDCALFLEKAPFLHRHLFGIDHFIFIMGDDTFIRFLSPRYYQKEEELATGLYRFLSQSRLIVFARNISQATLVASNALEQLCQLLGNEREEEEEGEGEDKEKHKKEKEKEEQRRTSLLDLLHKHVLFMDWPPEMLPLKECSSSKLRHLLQSGPLEEDSGIISSLLPHSIFRSLYENKNNKESH